MEIAIAPKDSIKLKGKNTTLIVDAPKELAIQANGVLLLSKTSDTDLPKVEGLRLVIRGAGEYEVGGIKITGIDSGEDIVYSGEMDGVRFIVGTSDGIEKILAKLDETPLVIIKASQNFNPSIVSTLSPSACLIYSEGRENALKKLGKDTAEKVSKYTIRGDKLPEEAQILSLE